ncbi:MAG TPA: hypothetical protein VHC19_06835 [Pirellulales bacterium]|jgi:hypothetical protein|nr:hypothetical protein [Pirellulales bacterium]
MNATFRTFRLLQTAFALVLLFSAGCSVSSGFRRDFNSPCCCNPCGDGLAGCWDGCWKSHCTDHHGNLQGIITRLDETHYCARFHGSFFKFLPFEYSMTLTAVPDGDRLILSGQKDLGKLAGGVYRFHGYATATHFHADYASCKDRGVFIMSRCGANACCCSH